MQKSKRHFLDESNAINPHALSSLARASADNFGNRLIQQKELRRKLGDVSLMWLFRHRSELPLPVLIAGRRFWWAEEVDSYLERLSASRQFKTTPPPEDVS